MDLQLNISQLTARWLERKARMTGKDEATVAAAALEELAASEVANGKPSHDRLRFFREWVASVPARPGPPVDASRDSIYD